MNKLRYILTILIYRVLAIFIISPALIQTSTYILVWFGILDDSKELNGGYSNLSIFWVKILHNGNELVLFGLMAIAGAILLSKKVSYE